MLSLRGALGSDCTVSWLHLVVNTHTQSLDLRWSPQGSFRGHLAASPQQSSARRRTNENAVVHFFRSIVSFLLSYIYLYTFNRAHRATFCCLMLTLFKCIQFDVSTLSWAAQVRTQNKPISSNLLCASVELSVFSFDSLWILASAAWRRFTARSTVSPQLPHWLQSCVTPLFTYSLQKRNRGKFQSAAKSFVCFKALCCCVFLPPCAISHCVVVVVVAWCFSGFHSSVSS